MEYEFIKQTVTKIITMIVNSQYESLYDMDRYKRIPPEHFLRVISEWGEITMPPVEAFNQLDVYRTDDQEHIRLDFDLWFNGCLSDLTLKCSVFCTAGGKFENSYAIEGIRML